MARKKAALWVYWLPLLLRLLPLFPVALAGGEISLRSELDESRTLRAQTALSGERFFCLLNLSRGGRGPAAVQAGLDSAFLTAGPIRRAGLLRLLFRPLRYQPGSGLFREATGLHLDGSLEGTRRTGLLLQPFPGRLGFFFFAAPGQAVKSGGFIRYDRGAGVRLEALALTSSPLPREQGKEWISVPAPYAGGRLLHLGARAGWAFPAWNVNLLTAACGGQRAPPGYLAQLAAAGGCGGAELALATGVCSTAFLTPDGRGGQPRLQAGLSTRLGGEGRLEVRGLAQLLLLPPACGFATGLSREKRGELSARLLLPARTSGCWRLKGEMSCESSPACPAPHPGAEQAGEGQPPGLLRLEAGLVRDWGRRTLEVSWVRSREQILALEVRSGGACPRWRGSLETLLGPVPAFRVGGGFELKRESGRIYARLSCRDWLLPAELVSGGLRGLMRKTSFTLGWETKTERGD